MLRDYTDGKVGGELSSFWIVFLPGDASQFSSGRQPRDGVWEEYCSSATVKLDEGGRTIGEWAMMESLSAKNL